MQSDLSVFPHYSLLVFGAGTYAVSFSPVRAGQFYEYVIGFVPVFLYVARVMTC